MCVGISVWLGWNGIRVAGWSNTDTNPNQPHRNSNTHRTKNNTINVVIQQNSSKLLMMDSWLLFFNYHNDARSNKHKITGQMYIKTQLVCKQAVNETTCFDLLGDHHHVYSVDSKRQILMWATDVEISSSCLTKYIWERAVCRGVLKCGDWSHLSRQGGGRA